MIVDIVGKPQFYIAFSLEQTKILMYLSECHYDAKCRSLSKPGGFVYGANNMAAYHNEDDTESAKYKYTWEEMDLMAKLLNMRYTYLDKPSDRLIAAGIFKVVDRCMKIASAKVEEWSTTYVGDQDDS